VSEDESAGLECRRQVEQLVKGAALTHGGRVIKTIGDAVMLEFYSAVEAVSCALAIQKGMRALNLQLDTGEPVQVRIGVHVGDVVEEDNDLYGNGVNIAQRIQTMAQPGGICISREVYVQIRPILRLRCAPVTTTPAKPLPEFVEVFNVVEESGDTDAVPFGAAAAQAGGDPKQLERLLLARVVDLKISACLRRGWRLVRGNPGVCMTSTGLTILIGTVANLAPYYGAFVSLGLTGAVIGGFHWFLLRGLRGHKPRLRDLRVALSPLFVPVMLAGAIADFPREFAIWLLRNAHRLFAGASAEDLRFLYELLAALIFPAVYFFVSWWFARVLVIDKGLDFWPALELSRKVVTRHWLKVMLLMLTAFGVSLAGVLLLGVGLLLSVPVGVAANLTAYETLFGAQETPPKA
jgi:hypothetical protein